MNPLVSVCIPCYNAQNTIERTIRSVLKQTYSNIEIIISDNASTDKTVEVVRQIQDERVKIFINETNLGMARNFQVALSRASGKYIKCLCADDIITPDCIEKQVNVFLQHPNDNIVLVTSDKQIINTKGKVLFNKGYPAKQGCYEGLKSIKKSLIRGTNIFGEPGCVMFEHKAAKQTDEFFIEDSISYVMDLHFYCQLLKHGNLYVIKEPLFSFRVINTSGTAGFKWSQAKMFNGLIDKYHRENFIALPWYERLVAKSMAWLMCIARNIVFKISK
ncbi:MAG: glycosyltransferase family 2 protein [Bacteroidales bacterium]|nr:glycosyltransferase family 2 protein [Bacteroidales bacterium]